MEIVLVFFAYFRRRYPVKVVDLVCRYVSGMFDKSNNVYPAPNPPSPPRHLLEIVSLV